MSARFVKVHMWCADTPWGSTACGKTAQVPSDSGDAFKFIQEAATPLCDLLEVTLDIREVTCKLCLKRIPKP